MYMDEQHADLPHGFTKLMGWIFISCWLFHLILIAF